MSNKSTVFAWEVSVKGTDWTQIVNARTSGQAKSDYYYTVRECWDVPYTAMRCRKIGAPHTSEAFKRNAIYRGLPNVRCGQRVKVGSARGVIVGHNSSANFNVLFDLDSPQYAGLTLNCHPDSVVLEPNPFPPSGLDTTMPFPSRSIDGPASGQRPVAAPAGETFLTHE